MRTSLLPGLLENIKRNLNFQQSSCRLFEIGKVFYPNDGAPLPDEPTRVCGVLVGNRYRGYSPLHYKSEETDINDARGGVETLLAGMRLADASAAPQVFCRAADKASESFCAPGYEIKVHSAQHQLGSIGKLKSEILLNLGIKRDVYYFDLDFSALCAIKPAAKTFAPLPVYPSVKRDIALLVPRSTEAGNLVKTVLSSGEKLVESCELFDVYQGDKIDRTMKSVALTITYRSATRTLTEKNVEKAHAKLVNLLTDTHGGSLREE
jgi:phenylalanyl-tRNA synthetase beta chain